MLTLKASVAATILAARPSALSLPARAYVATKAAHTNQGRVELPDATRVKHQPQ